MHCPASCHPHACTHAVQACCSAPVRVTRADSRRCTWPGWRRAQPSWPSGARRPCRMAWQTSRSCAGTCTTCRTSSLAAVLTWVSALSSLEIWLLAVSVLCNIATCLQHSMRACKLAGMCAPAPFIPFVKWTCTWVKVPYHARLKACTAMQ